MGDPTAATLDIAFSLFILFVYTQRKFNSWPQETHNLFDGRPSDYASGKRFLVTYLVYAASGLLAVTALCMVPQLTNIPPFSTIYKDLGIPVDERRLTAFVVLGIALLANARLDGWERSWREALHNLARIPREVEDSIRNIESNDLFMPTAADLSKLKATINQYVEEGENVSDADILAFWDNALENIEEEKARNSLSWRYLKCLALANIEMATCPASRATPNEAFQSQLGNYCLDIPVHGAKRARDFSRNLETMSRFYLGSICKCLVKRCHDECSRCSEFRLLGFDVRPGEQARPPYGLVALVCLTVILLVTMVSVFLLIQVINHFQDSGYGMEEFWTWSLGWVICLYASLFLGVVVRYSVGKRQEIGDLNAYIVCFVLATSASAVYFVVHSLLQGGSRPDTAGRVMLSMSFGVLCPFIYRAVEHIPADQRDYLRFAISQGLVLGIFSLFLQCGVALAFARVAEGVEKDFQWMQTYINANGQYLAALAVVGFAKGAALGMLLSYALQRAKHEFALASTRPRRRKHHMALTLSAPGNRADVTVTTRNVSNDGVQVQGNVALNPGERVRLHSPQFGELEGVVRWTSDRRSGGLRAGISLEHPCEEWHGVVARA